MRAPLPRLPTPHPSRIPGLIAHLGIFSRLSEPQVAELATDARLSHLGRGTPVLHRGEPLPGLIGIGYGLLKLAARGVNSEERVLRLLGAGESFGAASILLGRPCPVDVVTLSDTLLVTVPTTRVLKLVDLDPKFAHRMMLALAERNMGLLSELATRALQRGIQRVACYLDSLARPLDGSERCMATLPVAKAVIASRLGMKKETLSRLLHELAQNGLIVVRGPEVEILDRARLAEIAYRDPCSPDRQAAGPLVQGASTRRPPSDPKLQTLS